MIPVEILSLNGCDATPATIALVHQVAAELGLTIDLAHTVIATPEEAAAQRFIGSPSVRVNGLDIEPAARAALHFGMT